MARKDCRAVGRSLVLANETLHISLNPSGEIADIFYPHIGLESHIAAGGLPHKVGVFVDDTMHWIDEDGWDVVVRYHKGAMIGDVVATNKHIGIRLECTDAVSTKQPVFIRSIHVINTRAEARSVKLFYHQTFHIADSSASSTACYRPDIPAIMHFRGNRVFLATLHHGKKPFDQFSTGTCDTSGQRSTYHDAADGELSGNQIENGAVDSVFGVTFRLTAHSSSRCEYMLVAAESVDAADTLLVDAMTAGAHAQISETSDWWHQWLQPVRRVTQHLPESYRQLFEQSLFVIKSHASANGAVMASLDSSLRNHPQNDTYAFCWGRDAAYALWPLLRLGHTEEVRRYFAFTSRVLRPDGYLSHKYRADGSLGTTWLPYEHPDGTVHEPIQADETASTLFLFGQYYRLTNDHQTIVSYYESTIAPMANFLADYVGPDGLPLPSYHLWEHEYWTTTYTTAVTYAALLEASELAEVYGRSSDGVKWRAAAESIQSAAGKLYDSEQRYFYRGIRNDSDGKTEHDATLDTASLYSVFMYGLFDAESDEFNAALDTARQRLTTKDGLYVRFEGDGYFGDEAAPNAWPIVSLWMAEIAIERGEYAAADTILRLIVRGAKPHGMLSEQLRPGSLEPVSVQPLVWSHAEYVSTLLDMLPYYAREAHAS